MEKYEELQNLCENLKYLRRENSLSKKKMAKILEVGCGSLSKLERGEVPPRLRCEIFLSIYRYFGITPAKMLESRLDGRDPVRRE